MPVMVKHYLGDGVYAQWNGNAIVLTVEDGLAITEEIHLDSTVYNNLVKYVAYLDGPPDELIGYNKG